MSRALIIGAGGVAGVVIHKCCQNSEVFTDICIASRTKSKCDKFKEELQDKTKTNITTAQVNADNVPELVALMKEYKPDICINVALPYQDLHIMDACLECGVNYLQQPIQWPSTAYRCHAAVHRQEQCGNGGADQADDRDASAHARHGS